MLPLLKFGHWAEKNHRRLRVFDLLCAAAMLGWGAYAQSVTWLVCGGIVLIIVWIDPLPRLRRWLPTVVAAKVKRDVDRNRRAPDV